MQLLDFLHRWGGGLLGLILAVLGLSGALLIHKEEWIALPHASDVRIADPAVTGPLAAGLLDSARGGESLVFASERFGLVQFRSGANGQYVSQTGEVVARWDSQWQRPELWLFDLHHHLLSGDIGEAVAGLTGIAAIIFVVTGTILWWRTRRTFRLRPWPARLTGAAVRIQHRDLGIVAAPLLLVVALTGVMMVFRPVAAVLLAPIPSPAALEADLTPPRLTSGPLSPDLDYAEMVMQAHREFPDAEIRILALPRKVGDPVTVRLRQPGEWLPNGRTTVWFDAASGHKIASRDALQMQPGTKLFNMAYPVHAAKVGGLVWRLLMTFAGLAMTILGTLAVWSFWFRRAKRT